jgi:hypothetical protein
MSATPIIVGLIVAGAAMALFAVVATLRERGRWIERLPWLLCGLALCAFAVFAIGGHARRDARITEAAFKGATAQLRKSEASYHKRTGRWQTDPDALSLETGCWGVMVDWVGPAGTSFRGFDQDTEVAIVHASDRYEIVSLDPDGPAAARKLDARSGDSIVVAGHRLVPVEHPSCAV